MRVTSSKIAYIVIHREEGSVTSIKLREWCQRSGLNYATALDRIHRTGPMVTEGICYIEETSPLLNLTKEKPGRPRKGEPAKGDSALRKTLRKTLAKLGKGKGNKIITAEVARRAVLEVFHEEAVEGNDPSRPA